MGPSSPRVPRCCRFLDGEPVLIYLLLTVVMFGLFAGVLKFVEGL